MEIAFDTHKAAKTLATAGFTNEQVDANIEVLMEATSNLATKKDLNALEHRLTAKMLGMQFATVSLILGGVVAANFAIAKYLVIPAVMDTVVPATVEAVMQMMGK